MAKKRKPAKRRVARRKATSRRAPLQRSAPETLSWRQAASGRLDAFGRNGSYHIQAVGDRHGQGYDLRWLYKGQGSFLGNSTTVQAAKRKAESHNASTVAENPMYRRKRSSREMMANPIPSPYLFLGGAFLGFLGGLLAAQMAKPNVTA